MPAVSRQPTVLPSGAVPGDGQAVLGMGPASVRHTADQLIPFVNLSQASTWAPGGISQWVTAGLVVLGWVLATAIVAGVTRVLARV